MRLRDLFGAVFDPKKQLEREEKKVDRELELQQIRDRIEKKRAELRPVRKTMPPTPADVPPPRKSSARGRGKGSA